MQPAECSNKTPLHGKRFNITWIDLKINLSSIQIQGTWTLKLYGRSKLPNAGVSLLIAPHDIFHFWKTGTFIHPENQKRHFHCSFLWRMVGKHVPDTTLFTRSAMPAWKDDLSRADPGQNFPREAWLLPCDPRTPRLWEQGASSQPSTQCLVRCTRRCQSMPIPIRNALRL